MKPVKNHIPEYQIIYPIGSKLQWVWTGGNTENIRGQAETILVTGYASADTTSCLDCNDCDKHRYLDEHGMRRCHYRRPDSTMGLRFWRRIG